MESSAGRSDLKFESPSQEVSIHSLIAGSLTGSLLCGMNIYMGLKTGVTMNGSLIAALGGFWLLNRYGKIPPTILQTNSAQTMGSATGSMASTAGFLTALPAMKMLGFDFNFYQLIFWTLSVSFVGLLFSIPLRQQLLEDKSLSFPTGSATAATILDLFSGSPQSRIKLRALGYTALFSAAISFLTLFFSEAPSIDPAALMGLSSLSALGLTIAISPMLFGVGIMVGPSVGGSLFVGTIFAWGVLAPLATTRGWVPEVLNLRSWLVWPGVALMVSAAASDFFATLLKTWGATKTKRNRLSKPPPIFSNKSFFIATLLAVGALMGTAYGTFGISPLSTGLAVLLSYGLALVAGKTIGQTDMNPAGGLGKLTQLFFAGINPGNLATNLMAASITAAGARQSGDMLQDLKAGSILGASPRHQFFSQSAGLVVGTFVIVPLYLLFDYVYDIGGEQMPAPAAVAWKAMAQVVNSPLSSIPSFSVNIILAAFGWGVALSLWAQQKKWDFWKPSPFAIGLAFLIPPQFGLAAAAGSFLFAVGSFKFPHKSQKLSYPLAAGLIIGEGTMGLVSTFWKLLSSLSRLNF